MKTKLKDFLTLLIFLMLSRLYTPQVKGITDTILYTVVQCTIIIIGLMLLTSSITETVKLMKERIETQRRIKNERKYDD